MTRFLCAFQPAMKTSKGPCDFWGDSKTTFSPSDKRFLVSIIGKISTHLKAHKYEFLLISELIAAVLI